MAAIYIDNFQSALTFEMQAGETSMNLPEADVARVSAAMKLDPGIYGYEVGGVFMFVPLYIEGAGQLELVRARYAAGSTTLYVERTAALAFPEGAIVRSAPSADLLAAGHQVSRPAQSSSPGFVILPPGESTSYTAETNDIYGRVVDRYGFPGVLCAGEDWPAELVIDNGYAARSLHLVQMDGYSYAPFYIAGGSAGAVTTLALPETCRIAVVKIRKLPAALRTTGALWLIAAEFYG